MYDMEKDSVLENIFDCRIYGELEETLKNNKKFQEMMEKTGNEIGRVSEINLSHKNWLIVDSALCAYTHRIDEYIKLSYFQGFKDAINLLTEIKGLL